MANAGYGILLHNGSCSRLTCDPWETGEALKSFSFGRPIFNSLQWAGSLPVQKYCSGAAWGLMLSIARQLRDMGSEAALHTRSRRHLDLKQPMLPASSPNKNTLRNLRAGAESPSYYWFSLSGPMQAS